MVLLLGFAAASILVLLFLVGIPVPLRVIVPVLVVFLALWLFVFASMTVEVTEERILLWFGLGLIRKTFPTQSIRSAARVRNLWYYSWGIRLTPYGWLFSVYGLAAVQIALSNGRTYRIGTDQPEDLLAAVRLLAGIAD